MFSRGGRIRALAPAEEVGEGLEPDAFPLKPLTAPALAGAPLKLFVAVAEGPLAGPVRRKLMHNNGLPQVCVGLVCIACCDCAAAVLQPLTPRLSTAGPGAAVHPGAPHLHAQHRWLAS